MLNTIKMAGLALAVSLGGLVSFAAPSVAQSSSFEIIIGADGARVRAGDYCERNPWYDGCRDWRRGNDRGGRYEQRGRYEGGHYEERGPRRYDRRCSADDALGKARRMGLRRARIVSVGERSIQVAGRDDGRTVIMRFGRRGNCPVMG